MVQIRQNRISGSTLIWSPYPKAVRFSLIRKFGTRRYGSNPATPDIRTNPNFFNGSGRFFIRKNTVQEDPVIVRQNRISGTILIRSTDSEAAGTAGLGTE